MTKAREMMGLSDVLAFVIVCGAVFAPACANVDERTGSPANGAAGVAGATVAAAAGTGGSAPGEALLQNFDEFKLDLYGGYVPPDCVDEKLSYVVTRSPAQIAWNGCDFAKSPAQTASGQRPLSDAEVEAITRALRQIRAGTPNRCGADAAVVTLDLTLDSNTKLYADDFYSGCPWGPLLGRTFVAGMSELSNMIWEIPKD